MKKRSEATQTLRAGCSKADPQTNKQTHKQTGDYNTLRSVINFLQRKILCAHCIRERKRGVFVDELTDGTCDSSQWSTVSAICDLCNWSATSEVCSCIFQPRFELPGSMALKNPPSAFPTPANSWRVLLEKGIHPTFTILLCKKLDRCTHSHTGTYNCYQSPLLRPHLVWSIVVQAGE